MGSNFDWRVFFETIGLLQHHLGAGSTHAPEVQDMSLHNASSADPPSVRVIDVLFFQRLGTPLLARRSDCIQSLPSVLAAPSAFWSGGTFGAWVI
jgi:hypothetical protein